MPYDPYARNNDPYEGLGAGYYAGTIGGGAVSGAAAGSAFGPWGTLVGGLLGAGIGTYQSIEGNKAAKEAWQQQQELDAALNDPSYRQNQVLQLGLQARAAEDQAVSMARARSAELGLTPAQAVAMEMEAVNQVRRTTEASRPGVLESIMQADQMRRQGVLNEFNTAQGLANNASDRAPDYSAALGAAAQAATAAGTMKQVSDARAAAATTAPVTASKTTADGIAPVDSSGISPEMDFALSQADPWGYQSLFPSQGTPTTLTDSERAAVDALGAAPAAPAPAPGEGSIWDAISRAPAPQEAASGAARVGTGAPGARPAVEAGRAPTGPRALPAPGALTGISPETDRAVREGDVDALLSRVSEDDVASGYMDWRDVMRSSGISDSQLSMEAYLRYQQNIAIASQVRITPTTRGIVGQE